MMKPIVSLKRKFLFAVMVLVLTGTSIIGSCQIFEAVEFSSLSDLEDKRIGVLTGSIQALQAEERFPDAGMYYFSTSADMLNALRTNKIDAFKLLKGAASELRCEITGHETRKNRITVLISQ